MSPPRGGGARGSPTPWAPPARPPRCSAARRPPHAPTVAAPPRPLARPCRDGDVYIGSGWNELSAGLLIIIVIPLLGLLFAWATYGTLWATGEFY